MKLKFIYWFAYYNLDSPSVRYRGYYPLNYLKANFGINSCFITPSYKPKKVLRFLIAYFSALFFRKQGSVIVIQRVNSNFIYANLLKLLVTVRKENIIYDLDDADYLEVPPKTIYYFIRNCKTVSVGSNEIFKNIFEINKNLFLNTSPTPDLNIVKDKKNPIFTIGWIGNFAGGHKESMVKYFFPALENLPMKIKLILLGVAKESEHIFLDEYFKDHKNVQLEMPQNIDWTNENSIQNQILEFDIGIATLLDNEHQRSKSGFKAKQYLNNGVPVLSSDIPENNIFVKHGINGFLCSTPEEFRKRIIEVDEMKDEEYKVLSDNARRSISKFNLTKYCHTFISNFEEATNCS